jgi:ribosomal-protein-alanine N-acetyltransferase
MTVLETERLLFRDHEASDLDAFCAMEADAEVRRFVGGQPRSREAAESKFVRVYLPPVRDRLGMWATVYKPEGVYIGYCGVYPHFGQDGERITGEGALGFHLASNYWNRGLATEAGRAFVAFALGELRLSRIVTSVEIGHAASMRVLQKIGFRRVRTEAGEKRSFHHFELAGHIEAPVARPEVV